MINMASAQSYFGYCTAQVGGHTYVSEVVDVTTLPNKGIPTQAPFGKVKLVDYYDQVVKQWFAAMMSNKGLDAKQGVLTTQLIAGIQDHGNTCTTGYEPACLCQDKNAAVGQQKKDLRHNHNTTVLSDK